MSPLKQSAINAIESLPDDVDLDRLLEEIVYYAKVERGLKEADEGKVHDLDDVMAELGVTD